MTMYYHDDYTFPRSRQVALIEAFKATGSVHSLRHLKMVALNFSVYPHVVLNRLEE